MLIFNMKTMVMGFKIKDSSNKMKILNNNNIFNKIINTTKMQNMTINKICNKKILNFVQIAMKNLHMQQSRILMINNAIIVLEI